ncbi:hypothetical protein ABPG74_001315 [Tetrahymena malaccensis]
MLSACKYPKLQYLSYKLSKSDKRNIKQPYALKQSEQKLYILSYLESRKKETKIIKDRTRAIFRHKTIQNKRFYSPNHSQTINNLQNQQLLLQSQNLFFQQSLLKLNCRTQKCLIRSRIMLKLKGLSYFVNIYSNYCIKNYSIFYLT